MAKLKSKRTHGRVSRRALEKAGAGKKTTEWVASVIQLPVSASPSDEEPEPSDALVWLIPGGPIVGVTLGSPEELSQQWLQSFREATSTPMEGLPHIPSLVRVASPGLTQALSTALGSLTTVVCAPTPEVEEARVALWSFFSARGTAEKQSYLGVDITPAAVAGFFSAAARLFRAAPWKIVPTDTSILSLTVPELGLDDTVVCVIGQRGESVGVVLFADLDDFEEYLDAVEAFERGEDREMPPHLALNFDRAADMSRDLRNEIRQYGWEIASPDAYPWLVAVEADVLGRAPSRAELLLAETLALALAELTETTPRLKDLWKAKSTLVQTRTLQTHQGPIEATLKAPY